METQSSPQIKRTLGVFSIVLMVVAATAPLTVVAGTQPLVMTYTENNSIPVYYLATGAILLLFSVGFTKMSGHVPNAGAFYSYIQAGLGKTMGLGAATMALLSYVLICIAVLAYLGYATANTIALSPRRLRCHGGYVRSPGGRQSRFSATATSISARRFSACFWSSRCCQSPFWTSPSSEREEAKGSASLLSPRAISSAAFLGWG